MSKIPLKVEKSLEKRKSQGSFRALKFSKDLIDFSSNDYLGFARNPGIGSRAEKLIKDFSPLKNGSGGSRLLTGNHELYAPAEEIMARFHKAEAALIFNSGYDANLGFFSAVPGKGDLIFYDELIHASIRDGIQLSAAKALKFSHNDLHDLKKKINRLKNDIFGEVYLVTESIFSMDGDSPDLHAFANFAEENGHFLVVDEAHAVGAKGAGLIAEGGLQDKVFARLVTFGKALGAHGAAIVGPTELKDYLVNFARSLIYTTALPPHSLATIIGAYLELEANGTAEVNKLQENIDFFKAEVSKMGFQEHFLESESAVHCCVVPGNEQVRKASEVITKHGFDVRPILSPTVPAGRERLRICLHSYNSKEEITGLTEVLKMVL
ncbi:aminotransferase class I/II-fold pyridoxal phosphate-dependent enzyme [Salinimicrobium sp. HB62]|uniref:aminotransferase class I/II-fold pyridoxal phosphate-dependent enzyme n=1 Tax=Salinimicrobium sp. HB62 TaxID=3077781 RepID=UPI002D76FB28|nr:pyridoxal phosphate-dependent aminotransferase family protein [Salinimicrobium sp. HB62]